MEKQLEANRKLNVAMRSLEDELRSLAGVPPPVQQPVRQRVTEAALKISVQNPAFVIVSWMSESDVEPRTRWYKLVPVEERTDGEDSPLDMFVTDQYKATVFYTIDAADRVVAAFPDHQCDIVVITSEETLRRYR